MTAKTVEGQGLLASLIKEQPVRSDVTFQAARPFSDQSVFPVKVRQGGILRQEVDDGLKKLHIAGPGTGRTLVILSESLRRQDGTRHASSSPSSAANICVRAAETSDAGKNSRDPNNTPKVIFFFIICFSSFL